MLDKLTKLNNDNSQELWRLCNHTYPSLQKLTHQTEIKILISSHWPASHNLHISAHRHIHAQLSPASLPPVPTRERILNLRVPFHLPTRSQAINDDENPTTTTSTTTKHSRRDSTSLPTFHSCRHNRCCRNRCRRALDTRNDAVRSHPEGVARFLPS